MHRSRNIYINLLSLLLLSANKMQQLEKPKTICWHAEFHRLRLNKRQLQQIREIGGRLDIVIPFLSSQFVDAKLVNLMLSDSYRSVHISKRSSIGRERVKAIFVLATRKKRRLRINKR